ncbi:MAG: cytidine deaminase [Patescibacteria group bacterium]|jgi:cytidine deaminase
MIEELIYSQLTNNEQITLDEAKTAMRLHTSPTSLTQIGAAVFAQDSKTYLGVNYDFNEKRPTDPVFSVIRHAKAHNEHRYDHLALIARGEGYENQELYIPEDRNEKLLLEASLSDRMTIILSSTDNKKIKRLLVSDLPALYQSLE